MFNGRNTSCFWENRRRSSGTFRSHRERVPDPNKKLKTLRALIFDSIFNTYRGSVAYVRVMEGVLKKGRFRFMANDMEYNAEDVGFCA